MKINTITKLFKSGINKLSFKFNKNKPEILVATAIISSIGAVVTACIATNKANNVIEPFNKKVADIKNKLSDETAIATGEVNPIVQKKKLAKTYLSAFSKLAVLYSPSVCLLAISAGSTIGSHKIMKNRALALAAAYTTVDSGFKAYRQRVKERFGEDVEDLIYRNVKDEKVLVKKHDEQGNEVEVEEIQKVAHHDTSNEFGYLFDESNRLWENSAKQNIDLILNTQKWLNDSLMAKKYVFLDEVFRALNIQAESISPQLARMSKTFGWVYDPSDSTRDSFISFGITKPGSNRDLNKVGMDAIRFNQPSIWLSFNVDGDIVTPYDEKGKPRKTFLNYISEF